eukprot:TRINITY_DN14317_c0_g1_i2.p1 TRINITY_DN14317_c0_g1~~TRINITY_DN14317_c0_g1_i2.p1  ORF type:complete len:405 (-),score=74.65 TRINITY_DN14317_c0_g1_i2:357-1571(-)
MRRGNGILPRPAPLDTEIIKSSSKKADVKATAAVPAWAQKLSHSHSRVNSVVSERSEAEPEPEIICTPSSSPKLLSPGLMQRISWRPAEPEPEYSLVKRFSSEGSTCGGTSSSTSLRWAPPILEESGLQMPVPKDNEMEPISPAASSSSKATSSLAWCQPLSSSGRIAAAGNELDALPLTLDAVREDVLKPATLKASVSHEADCGVHEAVDALLRRTDQLLADAATAEAASAEDAASKDDVHGRRRFRRCSEDGGASSTGTSSRDRRSSAKADLSTWRHGVEESVEYVERLLEQRLQEIATMRQHASQVSPESSRKGRERSVVPDASSEQVSTVKVRIDHLYELLCALNADARRGLEQRWAEREARQLFESQATESCPASSPRGSPSSTASRRRSPSGQSSFHR